LSAQTQLFVNGRFEAAESGRTFARCNPLDGSVATEAAAASVADAERAVDAAQAAFAKWSALGPNARRGLLNKAADSLAAKAPELIEAMQAEIGATKAWAGFNIHLATGMIREAAALTTQIQGTVIPSDKPGCLAMALREPAGVVLGMAPWNAPVILGVRAIATPLACGNTVVLKASEICPRTHTLIGAAFHEAGLPDGVVNVITNAEADAPAVVGALIAHRAVRRVNFTGSTRVGRIIAELCARELKPVILELGGKAPLLVLHDADLGEAVKAAAFGAFMNQGQICMSTERIIVVEAVADEFVSLFSAKAQTLVAGDPREGKTPLGAMVDRKAAQHVRDLIADAVSQGARIAAGRDGTGGDGDGVLMPATVIDGVTPAMRLYREESFGPVAAIIRVKDEEAAIAAANDSEYGLAASVFSRDIARALTVARRIQSGICHINGPTVHDEAQMPFGGVKASGYGRFGGQAGVDAFTELRWITMESQPGHFPI
jgi:acyl-CoA reductase-like NAD-dependent aldehyde dehydrogenase